MDKTWMSKDRMSKEYEDGVEQFIAFAVSHASNPKLMKCPCQVCGNLMFETPKGIRDHMFTRGVDRSYKIRSWHGEVADIGGTTSRAVNFDQSPKYEEVQETLQMVIAAYDPCTANHDSFRKLVEDAKKPLYPGCQNYTKLSSLMELYNIKGKNGISGKCFSELLSSLGKMLLVNNEVPTSMYEAKKTMISLGLEYEKTHACPNNCILYRKEYKDFSFCPICNISRWKTKKDSSPKKRKGVPAKVLWYFPPIPRFKRMFQLTQMARDLTWHAHGRVTDGKLRHPADSPSWKLIDQLTKYS